MLGARFAAAGLRRTAAYYSDIRMITCLGIAF